MSAVPAIEVRPSGPLDLAVLAALHAACFAQGTGGAVWSASDLAEVLKIPGSFARLATAVFQERIPGQAAAGPVPAGLVLARVVAADSEILTLGVAPPLRRRGVARRLLGAALAESRRAGARAVFLEVAEDNPAAQAFYRAEGFARVGRRADYYRRPGAAPVAALVLSRRLESLKA